MFSNDNETSSTSNNVTVSYMWYNDYLKFTLEASVKNSNKSKIKFNIIKIYNLF